MLAALWSVPRIPRYSCPRSSREGLCGSAGSGDRGKREPPARVQAQEPHACPGKGRGERPPGPPSLSEITPGDGPPRDGWNHEGTGGTTKGRWAGCAFLAA